MPPTPEPFDRYFHFMKRFEEFGNSPVAVFLGFSFWIALMLTAWFASGLRIKDIKWITLVGFATVALAAIVAGYPPTFGKEFSDSFAPLTAGQPPNFPEARTWLRGALVFVFFFSGAGLFSYSLISGKRKKRN